MKLQELRDEKRSLKKQKQDSIILAGSKFLNIWDIMICHGKTKLTVNEESENQYGLDETVSDFDKELELLKEK